MRTVGAYRTKGGFRYATYLMTLVGLSLLPFLARAQQPLFGLSSDANIPAVRGQHEGADSGIAARFFILRPTNRSNALEVFTAGRGRAAYLRIDNPSNPSNALEVLTVGTGAALWGQAPTLAIFGYARATTGTTYGIRGKADSPQGYAGYFEGRGFFSGNVGIGTTPGSERLLVSGTARITDATALGSTLNVAGPTTLNNTLTVSGTTTIASDLRVNGNTVLGDAQSDTITLNGRFNTPLLPASHNAYDIGANSLRWRDLFLAGQARIAGNTAIGGDLTVFGRQTFNGPLTITSTTAPQLTVRYDASNYWRSTVSAGGAVTFTASGTSPSFRLANATTVDGTLSVAGLTTIASDLRVNGSTVLGDAPSDTITLNGRFNTPLLPASDNTYDIGSGSLRWRDLFLSRNGQIGGTLSVAGSVTLGSTLDVAGLTTIASDLRVNGSTVLGDAPSDTITLNGRFNTPLLPASDNTYDIGSGSLRWRDLFLSRNGQIGGTLSVAGSVTLGSTLDVAGSATLGSTLDVAGVTTFAHSVAIRPAASAGDVASLVVSQTGASNPTADIFAVQNADGSSKFLWVDASGVVHIAGNQQGGGSQTIAGDLTVLGNTVLGNEASDTITINGRLATTDLLPLQDNTYDIGSGSLRWRDLFLSRNGQIGGTLSVAGSVTLGSTLDVAGLTTIASDLRVNGSTVLGDAPSDTITLNGRFNTPLLPASDNTYDIGSGSLRWRDLFLSRNGQIGGTLSVAGSVTLGSTLDVAGLTTIASDLRVNGSTVLGDAPSDTITLNGRFNTPLLPASDNTYDIGSGSLRWRDLFLSRNGQIGGTLSVAGSVTLGSTLDVAGSATLGSTLDVAGVTTFAHSVAIRPAASAGDVASLVVSQTGASNPTADIFAVQNADGSSKFLWVDASGVVHIAGNQQGGGSQTIAGDLTVLGNTVLGNEASDTITINGRLATTDLLPLQDNTYDIGSGSLRWRDLFLSRNGQIGGTLSVAGSVTLGSTLDVAGLTTIASDLRVNGSTVLGDAPSDTITLNGRFNTPLLPASDNTYDIGSGSLRWRDLFLSRNGQIGGTLSVAGSVTLGSTLDVAGLTTIASDLRVNGSTVLGDAPSDTITLNGRFNTPLLPASDNTYDIGSGSLRWRDLFLSRNGQIGGTLSVAGSVTLGSTLDVAGSATLGSTLDVAGVTTFAHSVAIRPAASAGDVASLVVSQTGASNPTADIFAVQNADGSSKFLWVDASGVVHIAGDLNVGGNLSGAAGGDLSGTYPNPTVARIQGRAVANTAPADGQVLKWNASTNEWSPAADNDTTYSAGAGLQLVGTTFSIAPGGVATTMLADGAVTTVKIADDNVTSTKLSFPIQRSIANPNPLLDLTNTGTGGAGLFQINNPASVSAALEAATNGTGAALKLSAPTNGTALEINGGALKVTGAGIGTNTTVFIHQEITGGTNATTINHPLINGDPNAILTVTYNETGSGTSISLPPGGYGVRYNSATNQWEIYLLDSTQTIPAGATFNVMIVKP